MKASQPTEELTFGEFVVSFYESWNEPVARAMVSLALDAGLIVFQLPGRRHRLPENTRGEVATRVGQNKSSCPDQVGRKEADCHSPDDNRVEAFNRL